MSNFPDIKAFGTAPFEAFTAATASSTKGLQDIAAETTDYSKKSFEKSRVLFEKLTGVKKIDEAIQLQSDFAKSAYEDFMAQATKIGEMYSSLAKEAFKPITVASPAKPSVVAEFVEGAGRREAELISSGLTRHISANEKRSICFCSSSIFSVGPIACGGAGGSPSNLSGACVARSSNGRALFCVVADLLLAARAV